MKSFIKKNIILFGFLFNSFLYGQGFICAVGGGSEDYNSWSDTPYGWVVEKSNYGKVLVLSYSDQTDWIPNYFLWLGAAASENFKIPSRTIADEQATYDQIVSARAIFIKGGDQWRYVNYWKGTKTEDAIREVFNNGGVVAGTSAGAMVLSDVVFTAQYNSVYPDESLLNPFRNDITLDDDFLNLVPNTIFDTHFVERGRFGRLIAFIFNAYNTLGKDLLGIGIDDRTAICIEPNGVATAYGSAAVSVFQKDEQTIYLGNNNNYTIENLRCDQLLHGWKYDLTNRAILEIPGDVQDFNSTQNAGTLLTDVWLSGTDNIRQNIDSGLQSFLNTVNTSNVAVVRNSGYESNLTTLTDYLTNNSISYSIIPLSQSTLNDQLYSNHILDATTYIFIGDNLGTLSAINDQNSLVGNAFYSKIAEGVKIYFVGNTGKVAGGQYIYNTDGYLYAGYYGEMTNNVGLGIIGDLIFQPMIFSDSDYFENRTSALLWGLAVNQKRIGLYLEGNDYATINASNNVVSVYGNYPVMVIDTRLSTKVGFSDYIAGGNQARQIIGIDNLRYTISSNSKKYNLLTSTDIKSAPQVKKNFYLAQNYPNPFNNCTTIPFTLKSDGHVSLKIYDLLGRKVATLIDAYKTSGYYRFQFDTSKIGNLISTGIYFYKLTHTGFIETKKMIYLK